MTRGEWARAGGPWSRSCMQWSSSAQRADTTAGLSLQGRGQLERLVLRQSCCMLCTLPTLLSFTPGD